MSHSALYSRMKRMIALFAALMLALGLVSALAPASAQAASRFSTGNVTSDISNESPSELFNNPVCIYKGAGVNEGIEVWAEKKQSAVLPMDGQVLRDILFVNKSSEPIVLSDSGNPQVSGPLARYTKPEWAIFHPNPLNIKLMPGESSRATFTIDFGNYLTGLKSTISGKLTIIQGMKGEVKGSRYAQLQPFKITLSTDVTAYTQATLNSAKKRTATVKGYVKNSSGKPLSKAKVTISTQFCNDIRVTTNSKGYYKAKVYGLKHSYYGTWHQARVTVEKAGYATQQTIVRPKANASVSKNFKLAKKSSALSYTKTNSYNIGIQSNYFDVSADSGIVATAPFHSELSDSEIQSKSNLSVFTIEGQKLVSQALHAETPCVAVSEDGQYVATQKKGTRDQHSITVIYDKSGSCVYERTGFPPTGEVFGGGTLMGEDQVYAIHRAACFSKDNRLLVVASMDGDVYCLEWKSDAILWSTNIRSQVRTIEYSKDGNLLYLSSGDGYLYALSAADGSMKWKSYIGSWASSFSCGSRYLAVSTKNATHSLRILDAQTGRQLWSYDTPGRGIVALSPDESKVFFGNETSTSYNPATSIVLSTKTGDVLYAVENAGQMAAWSGDGRYLAVKTGKEVMVCKASSGEILWRTKESDILGGSVALAISRDGSYLAAGFNPKKGYGTMYFYKRK